MKLRALMICMFSFGLATKAQAVEIHVGNVTLAAGGIDNLAINVLPSIDLAAVALELQASTSNVELQSAALALGYHGFIVAHHSPSPGILKIVLYNDPTAPFTSGPHILNVRIKAKEDATLGTHAITLAQASVSDTAGISQPNVQLVSGSVRILSPIQSVEGTISAGETKESVLQLAAADRVRIELGLTGSNQQGCTVTVSIRPPAGATSGPHTLTSATTRLELPGMAGPWTFVVQGSGTCLSQGYRISTQLLATELGFHLAWLLVAAVPLTAAATLRCRTRRARRRSF
jgi:hypothetical protein